MRKFLAMLFIIISLFTINYNIFSSNLAFAQSQTKINNSQAKQMLIGKHRLQLQWLSFWNRKEMGTVEIKETDGILSVVGKQTKGDDFLEINGNIVEINPKDFVFDGKITMRVNYNNDGKPCIREGKQLFRISGARKFWRLKNMLNPCDNITTDYIDIFFKDN